MLIQVILKIQSQNNYYPLSSRGQILAHTGSQKQRLVTNVPVTLHFSQGKDEEDKNDFLFVSSTVLQRTNFRYLNLCTVEVKKTTEGGQAFFFHPCVKSSCCAKGHWVYILVLDQTLSWFLRWSCFYGLCRAVDVHWALTQGSLSRLVFIMSNYINLFYDRSPENLKNCVLTLHVPGGSACAPRKLCAWPQHNLRFSGPAFSHLQKGENIWKDMKPFFIGMPLRHCTRHGSIMEGGPNLNAQS